MNITKEMLEKSHFEEEYIEGAILMRDYSIASAKNGNEYFNGTFMAGVAIPFKVWNNYPAFNTLKNNDLKGKVVNIKGNFNLYRDTYSIIVNEVQEAPNGNAEDFLEVRYNAEAYGAGLQNLIKQSVSEKGYNLANTILFSNDAWNRFLVEFAASSHHDCFKSGLLAHTYKVTSLMNVLVNLYGDKLVHTSDEKDLYILGALLHDIGKIKEMRAGVYTRQSIVTHQYLGLEFIPKDEVLKYYNEEWYYQLVAIILQHHGEWGMRPHTVGAKVVHLIDYVESVVQGIIQDIEKVTPSDRIKCEGDYIHQYDYSLEQQK